MICDCMYNLTLISHPTILKYEEFEFSSQTSIFIYIYVCVCVCVVIQYIVNIFVNGGIISSPTYGNISYEWNYWLYIYHQNIIIVLLSMVCHYNGILHYLNLALEVTFFSSYITICIIQLPCNSLNCFNWCTSKVDHDSLIIIQVRS